MSVDSAAERHDITVIATGAGFAADVNRAAAAAGTRYLAVVGEGTQAPDGWLDPLCDTLDRDPRVTAAGPCVVDVAGKIVHAGRCLVDEGEGAAERWRLLSLAGGQPLDTPDVATPRRVTALGAEALVVRRVDFERVGGLDEDLPPAWSVADLCLRLQQTGGIVVMRPESRVVAIGAEPVTVVARFAESATGRPEPDFLRGEDGKFVPGPANRLDTYVSPLLDLSARNGASSNSTTATVVVLIWNALDYTRHCVASLLEHTDPRHRLLLVDNGSDPELIEYLEDLERGEPRIEVVFNGRNLGFAGGNNVGLAHARGTHVCLLNSDTVVTDGWLERLLGVLRNDPAAGLVGPVTNRITGGQQLPGVTYDQESLAGLEDFAVGRAVSEAERRDAALWLVGFCVLIRRELIERIGGLDEGFGQGNYEDTDYCLRAFLAGYRAVVARDSFVHHFGSRSFVDGDVDYARLLDEKFEIFRRKWNLAPDARETGDFRLAGHLVRGYQPALHFHPLPSGPDVRVLEPAAWELENWNDRGEGCFAAGHLAEAERIFRAVLYRNDSNRRAANDLACTLWRREVAATEAGDPGMRNPERLVEAKAILERILAVEPDNEDAAWNLQEIRVFRAEQEAVTNG